LRIYLLSRGRSFNMGEKDPWNAELLIRDLDLEPILDAMANGYGFVKKVA